MNLKIYYTPNIQGNWQAISIEYTYGPLHVQGDINKKIYFAPNDKGDARAKLKDWASENDKLLSEHLQDANISFIDAEL